MSVIKSSLSTKQLDTAANDPLNPSFVKSVTKSAPIMEVL